MRVALLLFVALVSVVVAASGCGGSPSPAATPYALPTVFPPAAVSHIYVRYGSDVVEYALPLSAASVPDAVIATSAGAFAVNQFTGELAAAEVASPSPAPSPLGVAIFNAPFHTGQLPAFTIPYNNASTPNTFKTSGALAFDLFGNLWACSDALREFVAPLSTNEVSLIVNTDVPAQVPNTTNPPVCFSFMQFDSNSTLWAALPQADAYANGQVFAFPISLAPPYATPPKTIPSLFQLGIAPLAFDGQGDAITAYTPIVVPSSQTLTTPTPSPIPTSVPSAGIGEFVLPIQPTQLPIVVLPTPGPNANIVAVAAEPVINPPHLYVGNQSDGAIYVYALPLQGAQSPIRVPCPSAMVTAANCKLLSSQVFQFGP